MPALPRCTVVVTDVVGATSTAPTSIAPGRIDSAGPAAVLPVQVSAIGAPSRVPALVAMWSSAVCAPTLRGVHVAISAVVAPAATVRTAASHSRPSGLQGAATAKLPAGSVVSMNRWSIGAVPVLCSAIACVATVPTAVVPKSIAVVSGTSVGSSPYAHTASSSASTSPLGAWTW